MLVTTLSTRNYLFSHDLAAVRYFAHEIAVMSQGEIIATAPAKSFYSQMTDPYVRRLQEASGLIEVDKKETGV